jgi:hypothetical protein
LTAAGFLLTGCPGTSYKSAIEKIQENNMDLPDPVRLYYNGLNYDLSDLFYTTYYDEFVLSDDADIRVIGEINLYFSVEVFDEDDAERFQFGFDGNPSKLDAVHDNYAIKRSESLEDPIVAIKKEAPKSVKHPGYIQVISGSEYSDEEPTSYFMSTLEIDGEYYVFQLIGKKENMGYLYDDFVDILSSVEK